MGESNTDVYEQIKRAGIELHDCPVPVASYIPVQKAGNLLFVSGQTAKVNHVMQYRGKVGSVVSIEEAYQSARLAGINILCALDMVADLNKIRIIKVTGYVNAEPDFKEQPKVINGVSDLMEEVFGENGKHARVAIGVGSLPNQASVEVEVIAELM